MTGRSAVISVPDLIRRGALAPAHVDPVDAVMGADWAYLDLGRGGAARLAPPLRIGARRKRAALGGVLAPNPQSMVKLIGTGGARNARGLKAQMAYLSRRGDVPLHASESGFGMVLGAGDVETLAAAWGLPESDRGGSDRTSHFVVSFPQGTDPGAAERAGRAWAAELFDSGAYGERWDYYTAFHTDTAYPHIHVVVARRGLDQGDWLKISARSAISFDRLREVQVEVAGHEGIALTATPRLARGVHDRPMPDAEIRRAAREGRAPVALAHSAASAVYTAAKVLAHARIYEGGAASLAGVDTRLAQRLEAAAAVLLEGCALEQARETGSDLTTKETEAMARSIEAKQDEARANFAHLDKAVGEIADPATRSTFLRRIAELKAEAAPLLREDLALQSYRAETPHPDYRGFAPDPRDPAAVAARAEVDGRLARLAERFGLDPAASLERYGAASVSRGLGESYRREEERERQERREALGKPDEPPERRDAEIRSFHAEAREIYRVAAEHARNRAEEIPRGGAEVAREASVPGRASRGDDHGVGRHRSASVEPPAPGREPPSIAPPTRPVRSRDEDDGRSR